MCSCANFSGSGSYELDLDNFSNDSDFVNMNHSNKSLNFDGENEFNNFLTQKGRERRKLTKAGIDSGLSKKDAKTKALESIPRDKLKDIIAKIRSGEKIGVIETPLGNVELDSKIPEQLDQLSMALQNQSGTGTGTGTGTGNEGDGDVKPTFFQKNKTLIIVGIVLVGGFIGYKMYSKKK